MDLVDPNGLLVFWYHGIITYNAAMDSGLGIISSVGLARDSMWADYETQDPGQAYLHAMAEKGENSYNAENKVLNYINNPCAPLGSRIHAAQDLSTPLHVGIEWTGFHFDMKTLNHFIGDIFPTDFTKNDAYWNTRYVLEGKHVVLFRPNW